MPQKKVRGCWVIFSERQGDMKAMLKKLADGKTLSGEEAEALMEAIISGVAGPEQIGFVLACLEFRVPTGTELAAFVRSLLRKSISVGINHEDMVDVCGTGGDGLSMFNVSTCVSFVVAASGLKVAKHGNRAVSSRCGSFDVLEELDINIAHSPHEAKLAIEKYNLAFLFAPSFHPILGVLAPIRRNLGVRTVLNALGPLLNPARVKRQLIGVYSPKLLLPVAEALSILGTEEAMVVHGNDGGDEIGLSSSTQVAHLKNGKIDTYEIRPHTLSFTQAANEDLIGGEAAENAALLLGVLEGKTGPHRSVTLLNAGAALLVGGKAASLEEGIELAARSIDSGRALEMLRLQQRRPIAMRKA